MKKVFNKKIVAFLLCMVFMSVAAYAALPTYTPESDGTYSIDYTDGTASQYYALLVVEGVYDEGETPAISEDTVLYIDQATANSSGDVSFDGWIPKNDEPATVYLGGSDLDGPVLLGYLGQSNFVVAGTVSTDSGTSYEATVTLSNADGEFTATSVNGAYTVEVPAGTYTFTVNVKNHLSYTDNDFAVSADVSGKDVNVLGGDLDRSGTIDFDDLTPVLNNYGSNESSADINDDAAVDFDDLTPILNNYGAEAVVE